MVLVPLSKFKYLKNSLQYFTGKHLFIFFWSDGIKLALSQKLRLFHNGIVLKIFFDIFISYTFQQLQCDNQVLIIATMKASAPQEYKVSFQQVLKFSSIYKKFIFQNYYQEPVSTEILIPKLKELKRSSMQNNASFSYPWEDMVIVLHPLVDLSTQ